MSRKVLLLEPNYKNKYPPMGLMKLATYFRRCGDDVRFYKGDIKSLCAKLLCEEFFSSIENISYGKYYPNFTEYIKTGKTALVENIPDFKDSDAKKVLLTSRERFKKKDFPQFDFIGITTLFTFYWKQTVKTINDSKVLCKPNGHIMIGGIASSILPDQMFKDTGIHPYKGLLDKPGVIDKGNKDIIDELPLDYSILSEIDYVYPANNAYFGYMTRGCPRNCSFCAVSRLEPNYKNYIGLQNQLKYIEDHFGAQKDLLLMDNNVFASDCFNKIIDEIKECGFQKGATYIPPNEYDIAINNLNKSFNLRAYRRKMVKLYDSIALKLSEQDAGDFYRHREKIGLLYSETATVEAINSFDEIARPLYTKHFRKMKRVRYIDFNQGVDARLVTHDNMKKLSEINIRPLRIAFDHYSMSGVYIDAVKIAVEYGIKDLSNYLLYNYKDKPEELYYRMKINVDLCEELGATIYSFPMKYHPIDHPDYYMNRDYIGEHWNRKFIRAIQAILNSTKGKIGRGKTFFAEAFGEKVEEFYKLLWMPETFIIYRRKYDADLRKRLADRYKKHYDDECDLANEWWEKFSKLSPEKLEIAKSIISLNKFKEGDYDCDDEKINEVLSYYKVTRDDAEKGVEKK